MAMKQWQEMKSRSQIESRNKSSENVLSRSTSSYNSIKHVSSENSAPKIQEEPEDKVTEDSQLQVVLTPRSGKEEEEEEEIEDEEEPETDKVEQSVPIHAKNSLSSVKTTSKKPKKVKSKKKSPIIRMNDEQVRASLIYAAKAKRKKLHGRLKNSNSKSTIVTRDSNFSDKKTDRKKFRRQKSKQNLVIIIKKKKLIDRF